MSTIELLQSNTGLFYALVAIISLCIGSFLNVVIYRLPLMMEREWRSQCLEMLEQDDPKPDESRFNLAFPASSCPHCGHRIKIWQNIPILSYLLLRGKCGVCGGSISIQYPLIEALTAILSLVVAWKFGVSWQTVAALVLTWALIAMSMIDAQKQLLPDIITLPLLWLGLLISLPELFVDSHTSIVGAACGYLSLWAVYHLFKLLTGKEGMGFGDFKLFAALGAWMGWKMLPLIIVLSSFVGAVIGIALIILTKRDRQIPIPFGPYLAIAGWVALIWGDSIMQAYFSVM